MRSNSDILRDIPDGLAIPVTVEQERYGTLYVTAPLPDDVTYDVKRYITEVLVCTMGEYGNVTFLNSSHLSLSTLKLKVKVHSYWKIPEFPANTIFDYIEDDFIHGDFKRRFDYKGVNFTLTNPLRRIAAKA